MVILTLRQFRERHHRLLHDEYGVSLAEARRLYPDATLRSRWWSYVLLAFEGGEDFSPQACAALTFGQMRELSRTKRGLTTRLPDRYLRPRAA